MWKAVGLGLIVALAAGAFVIVPRWQERPREYSHDSPEALVDAFAEMVESGDVHQIPELIYAEDEPMRLALRQMGLMLAELKLLAEQVNESFPDEVKQLREDAEDAAARGEATSLLSRLGRSAAGGRSRNRSGGGNPGDAINLTVRSLLASPYESFEDARDRLSVLEYNEGFGGLMWDGQMVMPPFGLSAKRDEFDGDWYIVLPLDLPVVTKYRPRSEEQWLIAGYLMQAWRHAATDLREGIESGELRSLDQVASKAGATVGPPTVMIGIAYSKQFEDGDD